MNHVTLMGRLCGEIELKRTQNGNVCTNFSLAVDRYANGSKTNPQKSNAQNNGYQNRNSTNYNRSPYPQNSRSSYQNGYYQNPFDGYETL